MSRVVHTIHTILQLINPDPFDLIHLNFGIKMVIFILKMIPLEATIS